MQALTSVSNDITCVRKLSIFSSMMNSQEQKKAEIARFEIRKGNIAFRPQA
jgi:hypothetical protein